MTEVSKSKQAIVIALSLPENNPYQIKEKVFDHINLYDLKREDGLRRSKFSSLMVSWEKMI